MASRRSNRCNRLPGAGSTPKPQPSIAPYIASSLVVARATLTGDDAVRQMASDMREAAHREGGLTIDGLELLGYSAQQIATLVKPARLLANKMAALT